MLPHIISYNSNGNIVSVRFTPIEKGIMDDLTYFIAIGCKCVPKDKHGDPIKIQRNSRCGETNRGITNHCQGNMSNWT